MGDTADTAAADTAGAAEKKQDRKAAKLAKQIGAFAKQHGGVEGQLAHIGQAGTRIVLVGTDGGWGDLVAPTFAVARLAAEKAALTLHDEFDGSSPRACAPGRTSGRGWPASRSADPRTRRPEPRKASGDPGVPSRSTARATPHTPLTR